MTVIFPTPILHFTHGHVTVLQSHGRVSGVAPRRTILIRGGVTAIVGSISKVSLRKFGFIDIIRTVAKIFKTVVTLLFIMIDAFDNT